MNVDSQRKATALAKLLPPGPATEELKRRKRTKELGDDDIKVVAEKLADNQSWSTLARMTKDGLLQESYSAELQTTYSKIGRSTSKMFDEVFCSDLAKRKIDPRAIDQIKLAVSFLEQGSKEAGLFYLLRVVEGVLTDLCVCCQGEIEKRKDDLLNTYKIEVNSYKINNEWGMYAKSVALNTIGVLDKVEHEALYQDIVLPRNKMFHSYLPISETEIDDVIQRIWALLHVLAIRIESETDKPLKENNKSFVGRVVNFLTRGA